MGLWRLPGGLLRPRCRVSRIGAQTGDLFTLRDGKIVRYYSYWNRADALEAAGLTE
ncbi:MAG: hypothetical protein ACRDMH_15180 [Solirubrobacterales bacterium]